MNKITTAEFNIDDILSVRTITMQDTDNIVKWRNNPRVMNNFLYRVKFTPEIHNNWMNSKVASGEVIQFIILAKGLPIGSVYFRDIDYELSTAEYGIFIGEDTAVGLGYGNKIANWAVQYAKKEMKIKTLTLRVLSDNISAIKSYANAGYKCVDTIENYIDGRSLIFMNVRL